MPEPFAHPPRSERFEVASRGDFVPGRLWHADTGRPPLVLIVPALGASKDAGEVEALAAAAAAAGFTAAAIDLPLQGERASPKLSARLAASAAAASAASAAAASAASAAAAAAERDRGLWDEFLRQAALDLAAARAALLRRHALDPERVACVAFASGAAAAEGWAAREPRVRLVRADGEAAPAELVAKLRNALAAR